MLIISFLLNAIVLLNVIVSILVTNTSGTIVDEILTFKSGLDIFITEIPKMASRIDMKNCETTCCFSRKASVFYLPLNIFEDINIENSHMACRTTYSFINGAVKFRFKYLPKHVCDETINAGIFSMACNLPLQTHEERIRHCRKTGHCQSIASICLRHISAVGFRDAFKVKGSEFIKSQLAAVNHTAIALEWLGVVNGSSNIADFLNDVMKAGHEQQTEVNHLSKDSEDKISKSNVAASMAYSLAAFASIPFTLDLSAFSTSFQLSRNVNHHLFMAVTYCNRFSKGLGYLLESALLNSIPLSIIGWGDPYPSTTSKITAILSFLRYVDDSTIIIFSDAYDAIYMNRPENIISDFIGMNKSIIFGGENACFPWLYIAQNFLATDICGRYYPPSTSPNKNNRFVNTGQWIAYAGAIKAFYLDLIKLTGDDLLETFYGTDQNAISMMIMSGAWDVVIDHNATLFQVAMGYKNEELVTSSVGLTHFNAQHERGYEWITNTYLPRKCAELQIANVSIVDIPVYFFLTENLREGSFVKGISNDKETIYQLKNGTIVRPSTNMTEKRNVVVEAMDSIVEFFDLHSS